MEHVVHGFISVYKAAHICWGGGMSTLFTEVNFIQLFCLLGSAWGSGKLRRCACRGGLEPVLQGPEGWMGEGGEDARTLRVAQGAGLQVAVEPCGAQLPTVMGFG